MKKQSAFTLVEMAMVLIIMGLIIGSSTKVFTSFSKNTKLQETKELLKQMSLDIEGFSKAFHRLPTEKEFNKFRMRTKDSWGKEVTYVTTKTITEKLCHLKSTILEHIEDEKAIKNLAFILVSSGPNRNMQTLVDKDKQISVQSAARSKKVDFDKDKINRVEPYDDIYLSRTLWSIQAPLVCVEGLK